MIVDNIKNASAYFCLGDDFKKALEFMKDNMETISESVVLDENVRINYASYNTKKKEAALHALPRVFNTARFCLPCGF